MDTNSDNLFSARSYAFGELLGGELSLVIPDMQRDYCWDKDKTRLFVSGIAYLYRHKHRATLGLLYGYENPDFKKHLNIIDGQQRLTTLYLLLGMLYRRVPSDELRRLLISDYKLIDDREPRLIYQARREALYFMSDLVMHFFLNRDGRLSQLERSSWYYASYDADLTVRSFVSSLRAIDEVLEQENKNAEWDFEEFARFVTHEVLFLYCDLGTQAHAEKMFVIINTTGEPLTLAQNCRSLALAMEQKSEYAPETTLAYMWNHMEEWFWSKRSHKHAIATASLDDLIALYMSHYGLEFQHFVFNTLEFYEFFLAYARLSEAIGETPIGYPTIPCIIYALRFPDASTHDLNYIWHFFTNITRYQRPSANENELAIKLVESMPNSDILSLLLRHRPSDRYLNIEERTKLEFIANHLTNRELIERYIWKGEAHPMLNGRVAKVINWGKTNEVETFAYYIDSIYRIWGDDIDKRADLDDVRRALLSICHHEYPIVRRGDTVLSLCWNDYDWQRLMTNAPGLIRQLIDRGTDDYGKLAKRFTDRSYPFYCLIKDKALMSNCRKRQVMRPCYAFLGLYDTKKSTTQWMIDQMPLPNDSDWRPFKSYGSRCLYSDHRDYNLTIDLYYQPNEMLKYKVSLFNRKEKDLTNSVDGANRKAYDLKYIVSDYGSMFKYDKKQGRYHVLLKNAASAIEIINIIRDYVHSSLH